MSNLNVRLAIVDPRNPFRRTLGRKNQGIFEFLKIWAPPFCIRRFQFSNFDFISVINDLENHIIPKFEGKRGVFKFLKIFAPPFWIPHFAFFNFDFRLAISDPKNPLIPKFKKKPRSFQVLQNFFPVILHPPV